MTVTLTRPRSGPPTPNIPARHPLLRLAGRFWPRLSAAEHRRLGYSGALLIAMRCASLTVPWVLGKLVTVAAERTGEVLALMSGLVLAYAALYFMRTLFDEVKSILFVSVVQRMMRMMARDLLTHLHHLPLAFHLNRQTGGLATAIERGTKAIDLLLNSALFGFLPSLLEVAAVCFIFWGLYGLPYATAIAAAIVGYGVFTVLVTKWRMKFRRRVNERNEAATTCAVDSLLNHETVKIFSAEGREVRRYDEAMAGFERASIVNQRTLSLLNLGQALIVTLGLAATLLLAAAGAADGTLAVGDLATLNAYLLQVFHPLYWLGSVYRMVNTSLVDMEKVLDLLEQPSSVADAPGARDLPAGAGRVEFRGVSLTLSGRQILRDVSFAIPAGKRYAIVGETGSGKTTITRLLARLVDPDAGQVLIDGSSIGGVTQLSVRRALAFVPQDVIMFNDTLRMNVAFGKPEAGDDEIQAALATAGLAEFVAELPAGLQTQVGERGLKLSGGERQRLAIARALLKQPRIFILDEATSALDLPTEARIKQAMDAATAGHTTLVIAHRLATVQDCDLIHVLDGGRIVESGTHEQLLASNGRYALSWRIQSEKDERAAAGAPAG